MTSVVTMVTGRQATVENSYIPKVKSLVYVS